MRLDQIGFYVASFICLFSGSMVIRALRYRSRMQEMLAREGFDRMPIDGPTLIFVGGYSTLFIIGAAIWTWAWFY